MLAIASAQRPAMRPEGMGLSGSSIASTCRSYQSFTAWPVPYTGGPASGMPELSTPHMNAHICGNHATGFSSRRTSRAAGTRHRRGQSG